MTTYGLTILSALGVHRGVSGVENLAPKIMNFCQYMCFKAIICNT